MNILIIITPFSPAQDPNTIRWTELATHFKNQGHTIHVLTTKRKAYKDFTTQNGIFIHRTGYHTLLDWLYNIIGQKNRRHEPGYTAPNPFYRSRFIQKIVDYFWRRNYWPDGQVLFLKPGIKKGKQLVESQSIDQIISVGAPFTSHWIAHALKTNYAQLKWHMDIQDPFSYAKASQINNNRKYDQRNMASEASCFDKATTISVPFEKSAERYRHFFSRHHSKIKIIPPLFVKPEGVAIMNHLHIDKTNIAYFGSFYENIRSPKALLDLMAFIKERDGDFYSRIKFHFIGQQNNYSLNVFNQYPDISPDINCHGFLQRDHAMALIAKMDYLVNFGNTTDYHLPSRVVEYLFFNKPTVNFPAIADDSFSDFVSPYIPLLNINPSKSLEHQYQQFKDFLKEAKPKNSANPKAIQPFLADTIGQAYLDLFQKSSN